MATGFTTVFRRSFGAEIESETLSHLRARAHPRTFAAGETLFQQGDAGDFFYIIVAGQISVSVTGDDGEESLIEVLKPGRFFGEMALIDDSPRMATCRAVTDVTVLEIGEQEFDELVGESPVIAASLMHRILGSMRSSDQRAIEELRRKNEQLQRAYSELRAAQADLVIKERLERELELAAEVQNGLLPSTLPHYEHYDFYCHLKEARQVGGDFYDVIDLDERHTGLLLADVADKGLHAAMFMAVTRTLFRQAARLSLSPAKVAQTVHEGMMDVAPDYDVFVTAFYGVLNRDSGRLTYIRAAQERPLLVRPGNQVRVLPGEGRFLGMLPGLELEEYAVRLRSGDRLVVFSDGVPDAINRDEDYYGTGRLVKILASAGQLSAAEMVSRIVDDVARWTAGAEPFDDLTLLVTAVD